MANQQVLGVAIIRINNVSVRSTEGAKLSLGGKERTAEYADGEMIGYSAKPIGSDLTATLKFVPGLDLDAINNLVDDTIIFEGDNGVIYLINNAFSVAPPEITSGNGEVAVHFAGAPAVRTQ